MKIAIDSTALYGRYSGVEYALWNLLGALNVLDKDNSYTVFVPHDGPPREQVRSFNDHWLWVRLPFAGAHKGRRILWQQVGLPRLLQRENFDLLHAPTYVSPLLASVPVVLTVYDLIALTHPQFATPLNRLHYAAMLPQCIATARRVIVPSEGVARDIAARVPEAAARTCIVPLGVEPLFHQPPDPTTLAEVRERYALPERFLLFVGNFEPKKNLFNLIKALRLLPDAPPLVVVGGARPWTGYEIETTGAANTPTTAPRPRVLSVGYVRRRDLPAVYALCEAFVFPSLAEGFGLPVLEALSSGAAVVTTSAVRIQDLHKVTLMCDPSDPRSIADRIARLLREPTLRADLRRRAPAFARPYTWRHTAAMTLEVYRAAAG